MSQRILWVLLLLSAFLLFVPLPYPAFAEGPHRAGLIVVYGPDNVYSTCVTFSEAELPGTELLRRAGLRVVSLASPGMSEAICKIGNIGCDFPGEECFCQCLGTPCTYWSYWYWEKGDWVYSGKGAGSRKVRDGDVDAWVWGEGNVKPPMPNFEASCVPLPARHTATRRPPTPVPTATDTPQPTVTNTPPPIVTRVPQQTNTPSRVYPETSTCSPTNTLVATSTPRSTPTPVSTLSASSQGSPYPMFLSPSDMPEAQTPGADVPVSPQRYAARTNYGAFVVLALVLLLLVGYAAYVRKRREPR